MRKTRHLLEFEKQQGRPAETVLAEALDRYGSYNAAAKALGISPNTMYGWTIRCGINVERIVRVAS